MQYNLEMCVLLTMKKLPINDYLTDMIWFLIYIHYTNENILHMSLIENEGLVLFINDDQRIKDNMTKSSSPIILHLTLLKFIVVEHLITNFISLVCLLLISIKFTFMGSTRELVNLTKLNTWSALLKFGINHSFNYNKNAYIFGLSAVILYSLTNSANWHSNTSYICI